MRRANVVFLVVAAFVAGLFAAVIAVMQSGDCWQNCDPDTDTVYSATPLVVYLAAVALAWASLCVFLWKRSFRPTVTWPGRLSAGAVAAVATVPLALVLTRVF